MRPIIIPVSYIGDPVPYTKAYLGNIMEVEGRLNRIPWIGTIPGHFLLESTLELSTIQEMIMDPILQRDLGMHVVGFSNPFVFRNPAQILAEDHPGLYEILEYSLLSMGERKEDIDRLHTLSLFKAFYGLSFVTRPHVLIEFTDWLSRVMMFMFSDPKAHNMLWSLQLQPTKPLSPQTASAMLGETLAPYFMNSRRYNIIKNPSEYQKLLHKREVLIRCRSERYMVPQGLDDTYDVSIFYHIGMVNNWKDIVKEQLAKIEACGLGYIASGLTITFSNPSAEVSVLNSTREIRDLLHQYNFSKKLSDNLTIIDASSHYPYEVKVMETMASFCSNQRLTNSPKRHLVFYLHDKGCSRYSDTDDLSRWEYGYVEDWRAYMEAFLIDRPSLCIRAMMNHGAMTCGVNLQKYPYMHYSGNFWSASCEHISGLPPTKDKWRPNDKGFLDFWYEKISPELWIGNFTDRKVEEEMKYLSLFSFALNLYENHAEYSHYQWIFNNVSLYLTGDRKSVIYNEDKELENVYTSGNLTSLWLEYNSSKPKG